MLSEKALDNGLQAMSLKLMLKAAALLVAIAIGGGALPPATVRAGVNDLVQEDYRFYQNTNAIQPTTALAAQNTAVTGIADGTVIRIRMNMTNTANPAIASGQTFKLQYSTSTGGPWTDVGGLGSASIWRGFDNIAAADGVAISSNLLTTSDNSDKQTYEEANPATSPGLARNKFGEWDWVVQNNGAAGSTTYVFRMIKGDDTALATYTRYPTATTGPPATYDQQNYRWYQNADAIQPSTALAAENTAITGVASGTTTRLRVNVAVGVSAVPTGKTFKLQYSTAAGGPWTDVGGIGSGAVWRGVDNATPADGATMTATLLTGSTVAETYEEASPSAGTPNAIPVGGLGEWDWVVQNNSAANNTTYYFQMVRADGTAFNTYTRYPQLTTAFVASQLTQRHFQWYQNADAVQPVTSLAALNTAITDVSGGTALRLRMNVEAATAGLAPGETFKLQYTTDTNGAWTDVGAAGSGSIWRGYDNPTPADGATLSAVLLSTSNVVETYEEGNNSAATPTNIAVGQKGEWDWVVQQNGAAGSTAYYFRMVKADNSLLAAYASYPQLTTAALPVLSQKDYRWYDNADSVQPITALAAEDTPIINVASGNVRRLRLNLQDASAPLNAGATFKLQYSAATGGPWTDVGGVGSAAIWRGFNNSIPADGAAISSTLLSSSTVKETYEEENSSAGTPLAIPVAGVGEWDWVIQNNGATAGATYFFRMVNGDGTALSTYVNYPQLTTTGAVAVLVQNDYRWYQNLNAVQPATALAAENTASTGAADQTVLRIRVNLSNTSGTDSAAGEQFKLQYATSTSGPWTDVGAVGSGAIWRGYDNATPADGAALSSSLLNSSTNNQRQTYEEANPATSSGITGNRSGEWDWVVQHNGAAPSTTYYFRIVKQDGGVLLNGYNNYPTLTTAAIPVLTQKDYRWYQNVDAVQPTTALAAENSAATGVADAAVLRLRMNVEDTAAQLAAGQLFKLQYATSTGGPWTDVGAVGSGALWRGSDNAAPADGAALAASLLSTSTVGQTYEEQNNTAATPNAIPISGRAEWDWVVQSNGAAAATTYFFRMVKSTGTALDAYTAYPQLTTAGLVVVLVQNQYQWYQNVDAIQPATSLAAANTAITGITDGAVLRIRMNISNTSAAVLSAGELFKLQHGTSTGGPWTDVGAAASAAMWRGFDNPTPADGALITSSLLPTSDNTDRQNYEEANPGASPGLGANKKGEWDWVVQHNGAAGNTAYYFRLVKNDGTVLDGYTVYPQVTTAAVSFLAQKDYQWFSNADAVQPGASLAALNTAITAVANTNVRRLRVNIEVTGAALATGQTFKLQYSLATSGPWSDLGGLGSGTIWRGSDNATPADGATVTATLLAGSTVAETYEEANNTAASPNTIPISGRGEWDWVIQNNGADTSTAYYFRMVKSDGNELNNGYVNYPQLTTQVVLSPLTQKDYRWYQNANAIQPTTALAAQNVATSGVTAGTVLRLRMNVSNGPTNLPSGQTFKLQFSTSQSGPWTDVGAVGSGVIWRGFDNATPADGAAISSNLLAASNEKQTYEEANNATSPGIAKNNIAEWDWVVQHNGAISNTVYYFRMSRGDGSPLETYLTYPGLLIGAAAATLTPNGAASSAPETVVSYTHAITNTGGGSDTFDLITGTSSQGWTLAIYQADGTTPLADTDGDTVPDVGLMAAGAAVSIVVKITIGWTALTDTISLTIRSSADTAVTAAATDSTTVPPTIIVTVADPSSDFGTNIGPTPTTSDSSDSVVGYAGATGNQGMYYVWRASGLGLTVTVKSNKIWSATIQAAENSGTSPSMTVASGAYRYSEVEPVTYAQCAASTAFTTSAAAWKTNIGVGVFTYTHFYCLRSDWTDDPGTFVSSVTYTATQN